MFRHTKGQLGLKSSMAIEGFGLYHLMPTPVFSLLHYEFREYTQISIYQLMCYTHVSHRKLMFYPKICTCKFPQGNPRVTPSFPLLHPSALKKLLKIKIKLIIRW